MNKITLETIYNEIVDLRKDIDEIKAKLNEKQSTLSKKPFTGEIKDPNSPMTEKQRLFLEKNEYNGDMDLTKKEASELINAYINNLKRGNI